MNITVRAAAVADEAAIRWLDANAAHALGGQRGGPELLSELGELVSRSEDGWHVAVAEVDGVVLGVARTRSVDRRGRLVTLFVEPAARRIGLGHRLVRDALMVARGWGCEGLDAVALPGDRATKNFFEAHQMRARLLIVSGALDG